MIIIFKNLFPVGVTCILRLKCSFQNKILLNVQIIYIKEVLTHAGSELGKLINWSDQSVESQF